MLSENEMDMQELTDAEMEQVNGGKLSWTSGGSLVIGLGFCGGPATAAFGLLVGGAMLAVGEYE